MLYREYKSISEYVFNTVLYAMFGAIAGIVLVMILGEIAPVREVTSKPIELVSMRSVDGSVGTFVLGSGGVDTETSLHFYYRDTDGTMVPGSVPADDTVHITEDQNLKNVGYWDTVNLEYNVSPAFAKWLPRRPLSATPVRQEFRVPVGSVVHDFSAR